MLKSWNISGFPNADPMPDPKITETLQLLDSGTRTIILLSLLISNNSGGNANVVVQRLSSTDEEKASWRFAIPAGNSPVAIDSKMVFANGDKIVVTSDQSELSVDASGDES